MMKTKKWFKEFTKAIAMVAMLAILVTLMPTVVRATNIYDTTNPETADPELMMVGSKALSIGAGEERIFYIQVKNISVYYNVNVTMTADIPFLSEEYPFEVTFHPGDGSSRYRWRPGESQNVPVRIVADRLAKNKTYSVEVTYLYKNERDYTFTKTETIQIRITDELGPPKLELESLKVSPEQIIGGAEGVFSATLENKGVQTAQNIRVSMEGLDPSLISIKSGSNVQKFDSILPGKRERIYFTLQANAQLPSTNYPVTLRITYTDERGEELSFTQSYYVSVIANDNPDLKKRSNLVLEAAPVAESYKIGEPITVKLNLKNTTEHAAKNIKVTAVPSSAAIVPMSSNIVNIAQLAGNEQQTLAFSFEATAEAGSQNYPISFQVSYENGADTASFEQNVGITIVNAAQQELPKGILEIKLVSVPTGTYRPGGTFTAALEVVNTSDGTAQNIKVTAQPPTEAIVPMSASVKAIPQLKPGETAAIEFQFSATKSARTQNYPINFKVDYETGNPLTGSETTETVEQYIGVNVSNPEQTTPEPEDPKKNTPKIIISEYKCDPFIVNAGESFDLTMQYLNTNTTKTVKNIRVYLTAPETDQTTGSTIFTPESSSNTFYIDEIQPKASVEKVMRFIATPNAQPKTYTINVNFEYEDEEGNEFKTTELVGINVEQPARIVVGDMMAPTDTQAGMPFNISFDFFNMGKVDVSNLMISVDGDMDVQPKSTFYGNFSSGYSEYFDVMVTAYNEGLQNGEILIEYDDPTGEHHEIRKEFSVNVFAPYVPEDFGMGDMGMMDPNFMQEEPQGFFAKVIDFIKKPLVLIIGGIIIAGAAVATVFIIRAKRKKKGFDIDEQL